MEMSMLEKLKEARRDSNVEYVDFFNDGTKGKDIHKYVKDKTKYPLKWSIDDLMRVLAGASSSYSADGEFDTISMDVLMGLMFKAEDVDDDLNIKPGAKPESKMVRYTIGDVNSYLDGEQTNTTEYNRYRIYDGYVGYNDLVKYIRKNGLEFNGPKSFEEFKEAILSGETFDISINAVFQKEKKLVRKL